MRAYPQFLVMSGVGSFASMTAFTLNLVYQVDVVGLGPLQLILVGTLMEAVCFIAQVPTGVIADLYSRRLSVILGNLLMGAGLLLWGLVPSFAAILVANVIWAVGATCVDGAAEAWAADEIGPERIGPAFARGAQVAQAAMVLGIGASVVLAQMDLALPIVVGGVVTIGLGLLQALLMPEVHFTKASPDERGSFRAMRSQVASGVRVVRRGPVLLCLLGATLFLGMSSEGFDRFGQPHFLANMTFPASPEPVVWFGAFSIAAMLGSIVLTEAIRRRVDAMRPRTVGFLLAWFQGGAAVAVICFAVAGGFGWAVAAFLIAGLLKASSWPLFAAWTVAQTEPSTRATVFSIQAQADAAGQIAGGPPVGVVGQRASLRWALASTGLLMIPAVAFLVIGTLRQSPTREASPAVVAEVPAG